VVIKLDIVKLQLVNAGNQIYPAGVDISDVDLFRTRFWVLGYSGRFEPRQATHLRHPGVIDRPRGSVWELARLPALTIRNADGATIQHGGGVSGTPRKPRGGRQHPDQGLAQNAD